MEHSMFITPEIKARYITRREGDITTIRSAMDNGDFTMIAKLGHDWKGNGETYGFPEFSRWGRDLEIAAHEQKVEVIRQLLQSVATFIGDQKNSNSK